MIYIFFLIAIVAAFSRPRAVHSDLTFPVHLEKRLMSSNAAGRKGQKMRHHGGKGPVQYMNRSSGNGSDRTNSPTRESDTYASAKATGPGEVVTSRAKYQNTEYRLNSATLNPGQVMKKEIRDPVWSRAEAYAEGDPPRGAASQSHLLHPVKVEGMAKHGRVTVSASPLGGYAKLKKEVNGEVVKDERIPAGQTGVDIHVGTRPGEVKYTASSSRGGEARVLASNQEVHPPN